MGRARATAAAGALVVEAGLAVLGVLFHYGFTAEYADITDSAVEVWRSEFSSSGIGGLALALVLVAAFVASSLTAQRWARLAAVAIPLLMVVGMLAVTPAALREKLAVQYDATPRCVSAEEMGPGPGSEAARDSQQVFESVEHVGHFGGGGSSGVGGCDRPFVLTDDVDVLQHYRAALPRAGWRLIEDDSRHVRAERGGMAVEVVVCGPGGGVVWAGEAGIRGRARCQPVY